MRTTRFEALEQRSLFSAGGVNASFGVGGKIVGHANLPADLGFSNPVVTDMVLQADGNAVVAGGVGAGKGLMLVARFNKDGSADETYGSGGYLAIDFGESFAEAHGIALDASGRAIVVGVSSDADETHRHFAVARVTTAGKLDKSFSGDGMILTGFGQNRAEANDVAIAPDGKIVVAGYMSDGVDAKFAVARYTPSGRLDSGFSIDGLQTVNADAGDDAANAVAVLGDGRVVMAGTLGKLDSTCDFAIVRLTSDGQLDKSFDGNGIAAVDFDQCDVATSLLIDGDRYVVAGSIYSDQSNYEAGIARLTSSGAPDPGFGTSGKIDLGGSLSFSSTKVVVTRGAQSSYRVFYTIGAGHPIDSHVLSDGSIETKSVSDFLPIPASHKNVAVAQMRSDGTVVLALNGTYFFELLGPGFIQLLSLANDDSLASQPRLSGPILPQEISDAGVTLDGKLALAGLSQFDYLFYRYNADGTLDKTFGKGGRAAFEVGPTSEFFQAPTLLLRRDGGLVGYGAGADPNDLDSIAAVLKRVTVGGTPDVHYARDAVSDESGGAVVELLPDDYISVAFEHFATNERRGVLVRPDGTALDVQFSVDPDDYMDRVQRIRPIGATGGFFVFGEDGEGATFFQAIVKQLPDGVLDPTFGDHGTLRGDCDLVAAQDDGKFLYRASGGLKRRNQGGAIDNGFGINGVAASGYSRFTFDSLDRIIALKKLSNGNVQVARFTPEGKVDTRFGGGDGVVVVHPNVIGNANVLVAANDDLVVSTLKTGSAANDWFATRLSGGGFADLSGGKLIVSGSTGVDAISLTATASIIRITMNGVKQSFMRSPVQSIEVQAYGGDDVVNISNPMPATFVDGGDGNDVLTGGSGNDTFIGGLGRDALIGHGGNDHLEGGVQNDYLEGDEGNDELIGGSGNDKLDGGAGVDLLAGGSGDDMLFAKDGVKDFLDGGTGNDTAKRDKSDAVKDSVLNIESFI